MAAGSLAGRSIARSLLPYTPRAAFWLSIVALGGFLSRSAVVNVSDLARQVERDYALTQAPLLAGSDFPAFYAGGRTIASGGRAHLYEVEPMVRTIERVRGFDASEIPTDLDPAAAEYRWHRYYNPPVYLAALSALTLFDVRTAYLIAVGGNAALIVVLAFVMAAILRWRQPLTLLLWLALAGYAPLAFTLHHTQPTSLVAIALGAGYLALRSGRTWQAALLLALTGVKPHWLAPAWTLLKDCPELRAPLLVGCLAFLVLPFVLLGPGSVLDYARLITSRGSGDLTSEGFATALLSWSGFFRALTGEARPVLWLAASAATLGAFVAVWLRRQEPGLTLAAAVLTALLVVPHSHPQDWLLLAPLAAVLLSLRWSPLALAGIVLGLAAVYLGANDWQAARDAAYGGSSVYWATLSAFALLVWLAAPACHRPPALTE